MLRSTTPRSNPLRRIALAALVPLTLLAVSATADGGTLYGDGPGDLEPTPVATILADPEAWDGREVQVRGEVSGVCERKGCWIEIDDQGDRLQVKVDDDVIVFPPEAKGEWAVARGRVEILELERDAYVAWRRHEAEEGGAEFDEAAIEPPYRIVRLKGVGARIGE